MRVLVTGAYGLIGSAIVSRLQREGHWLVASGRSIAVAQRRFPAAQWIEADFSRLTSADAWVPLLGEIGAVVNCVGVLQDSARDDTRRVHVEATCALFEACQRAGVHRVVHVSAIGAEASGATAFARTKAEADAHLAGLDLDWVILRPALVMSPAVYGGSAMLRALAAFPLLTPVIEADSRIQIVSVEDVAETVAFALRPKAPARVTWELAHPQVLPLAEIVAKIRAWLGFPPRPVVRLPPLAGKIVSAGADALGWLGWRSPARSTALAQLSAGVVGDPRPWMAATGIEPQGLDQFLAAHPSNVQDRWFARLYLLKPLAIAALALIWIAHGGVGLVSSLNGIGLLQTGWGNLIVLVEPFLAIACGLGVLLRSTARASLIGMIALSVLVTAPLALAPWYVLLITLVVIVLNLLPPLFVLAILDDR